MKNIIKHVDIIKNNELIGDMQAKNACQFWSRIDGVFKTYGEEIEVKVFDFNENVIIHLGWKNSLKGGYKVNLLKKAVKSEKKHIVHAARKPEAVPVKKDEKVDLNEVEAFSFKPRGWQKPSMEVLDRCIESEDKEQVSIEACVASGKTAVCIYGFGKYITEHRNEKTVQMFVSPRIKLCKQQKNAITTYLKKMFGLEENKDYDIIPVNCTEDEYNKKSIALNYQSGHVIFVVCDESLWGEDKKAVQPRFKSWIHKFEEWQKQGWNFGCCVFDEAHNYENKQEEMFGNWGLTSLNSCYISIQQKGTTNENHQP